MRAHFTVFIVIVWAGYLCTCTPLIATNSNVAVNCSNEHSEGVTWEDHCIHLKRKCEANSSMGIFCGDCFEDHVQDKYHTEKCVNGTCNGLHSSLVGTWNEHCAFLGRTCNALIDAECGDCLEGYVVDDLQNTTCVANNSCDGLHGSGVTWQEYCSSEKRECVKPIHNSTADCGSCIDGYIASGQKCIAKRNCAEFHPSFNGTWAEFCDQKNRVCTPPTAENGPASFCGGCIANSTEDKIDPSKCVVRDSCEGSHPHAGLSWEAFCADRNRECIPSTNTTDAECGNCMTGFRPDVYDFEKCVNATLDCEGRHSDGVTWREHCSHLKRVCLKPASPGAEASCGQCLDNHTEDLVNLEKCVATNSCDVSHSSGVGTWKDHCDSLKRKCNPPAQASSDWCGDCLDNYVEDRIRNETCVAKASCDGTHNETGSTWKEYCRSIHRLCTPSTDTEEAKCGACVDGYEEDIHNEQCTVSNKTMTTTPSAVATTQPAVATTQPAKATTAHPVTEPTGPTHTGTDQTTPSPPPPQFCRDLVQPDKGNMTGNCNNAPVVGSVCKFDCKGLTLDGKKELQCVDTDGKIDWNDKEPTCSAGLAVSSIFVTLAVTLITLLS